MGISKIATGVAAVTVMGFAGMAQAVSVNYQVGGITVDAYDPTNSDNGLEIHHSVLSPSGFTLDDGQTHTFDAFRLWTPEGSIGWDDLTHQPITVEMSFSAPGGTAVIGGETYGTGKFVLFGFVSEEGHVDWNGPAIVDIGSVVYKVELCDADFQYGLLDLASYDCNYATIKAKVTQISSVNAVPTPAAAGLGLSMLAGLVMKRRKA